MHLNIIYAEYIWQSKLRAWYERCPLGIKYPNITSPRTRRKICKGGISGISNAAWRKVAKSKSTNLSLGMIDCVLEPMSVPVAVSHFSESVETEMRKNGDQDAADLCRDIRL